MPDLANFRGRLPIQGPFGWNKGRLGQEKGSKGK